MKSSIVLLAVVAAASYVARGLQPRVRGPERAALPTTVQTGTAAVAAEVSAVERAFAKTMADRNHAAFVSFLADETVFMPEGEALRGKQTVAAAWKRFYDAPQAPFSWEPDRTEVLDSGALAMTSGPVRDPQGNRLGTFNSVWRREAGGWKIVFDKGCPRCDCR